MSYLTENRLKNTVDLPIALPATTIKQADWLVVSTIKVTSPARLSLRVLNLHLMASSVNVDDIASVNKVVSNLGLVYAILRLNYVSGSPGIAGGLDSIKADDIGVVSRSNVPLLISTPGNYSLIVCNNCTPSSSSQSVIPSSTSIDFKVCVTGQFRLEMNPA